MHKLFWHKYYHFAILLVGAADLPRSCTKHYNRHATEISLFSSGTDRLAREVKQETNYELTDC